MRDGLPSPVREAEAVLNSGVVLFGERTQPVRQLAFFGRRPAESHGSAVPHSWWLACPMLAGLVGRERAPKRSGHDSVAEPLASSGKLAHGDGFLFAQLKYGRISHWLL
jgi:hypothetical protein